MSTGRGNGLMIHLRSCVSEFRPNSSTVRTPLQTDMTTGLLIATLSVGHGRIHVLVKNHRTTCFHHVNPSFGSVLFSSTMSNVCLETINMTVANRKKRCAVPF